MPRFDDRALAKNMLELREHGFLLSRYVRRTWHLYGLILVIVSVGVLAALALGSYLLIGFFVGLVAGTLARDFGWLLAIKRSWPFTRKVTNWEEVERLAGSHERDLR